MSLPAKSITLTTGGFLTKGFTFSVLSNQAGHEEDQRDQLEDPLFVADYDNQPFVAGVVYRFLGYHPVYMADQELVRVVFKESGGYDFLDPNENPGTGGEGNGSTNGVTFLPGTGKNGQFWGVLKIGNAYYAVPDDPTLQIVTQNGAHTTIMPFFEGGINAILPTPPPNTPVANVLIGNDGILYRSTEVTQPTTVITWTVLEQYIEEDDDVVDPPDPPPFHKKSAVDVNDCEQLAGWGFNDLVAPAVVTITVDGVFEANVTAQRVRTDVRDALIAAGIQTTNTIFGFNYMKPAKWRDGVQHTWRVFVDGVEAADYNVPKEKTCAAPVVPDVPYEMFIKQSPIISVNKAGDSKTVTLIQVWSDWSETPYTGPLVPVWGISNTPTGIVAVPYDPAKTLDVAATSAATVSDFVITCSLTLPQTVQVITVGCTRPGGLTTYNASYHFIPTGGFSDPPYPTLDEANDTAGEAFDGTRPGNLDMFIIQAANLNVGTDVYLLDNTTCEKAGDNIYSVFDSQGGNTVKKAIQVVGGKIVAVKDSTYTTPVTPPSEVGATAINVIFSTISSSTNLVIDYEMRVKCVTAGLTISNQFVTNNPAASARFLDGLTVETASVIAGPYKSFRNTTTNSKYYSFALSLKRLKALYPTATTVDFDVIVRRKFASGTSYDADARYRVTQVNFSNHRSYGIVSIPLNDKTGVDYDYNGISQDGVQKKYLGDSVQGVLIPAGQDYVIARWSVDLPNNTATLTETVEPSP
ncbi:hypothetical protein [Spirosoma endbachense]|uniref:Uncharacterized protein n=1 Tax=Spirosoma endbachense TaxID=2666025 RepID=A0A6P1VWT9_9BACT|nr:hypothetical protein [Spirosoma endbachense]QHV96300.1 hypothetical protein GJR95_15305 [Spirosoma endbachense]